MNETLPTDSGALVAEGCHAESNNYRTQPTCWLRIMVCSGKHRARWCPYFFNFCIAYTSAIWYWRSILWSIESCQIKVSIGSGLNSSRSSVFLKLPADQFMDFHWNAGSSIFINYQNKPKNRAPLLGLAKSIYYSNFRV